MSKPIRRRTKQKTRPRSQQRVVGARRSYLISEERILEISNDISEDMCRATVQQLIEVVKYFRDHFDAAWRGWQEQRMEIALDLLDIAQPLMNPQNRKRPNDKALPRGGAKKGNDEH